MKNHGEICGREEHIFLYTPKSPSQSEKREKGHENAWAKNEDFLLYAHFFGVSHANAHPTPSQPRKIAGSTKKCRAIKIESPLASKLASGLCFILTYILYQPLSDYSVFASHVTSHISFLKVLRSTAGIITVECTWQPRSFGSCARARAACSL